jgi:proteasome accessory factor B
MTAAPSIRVELGSSVNAAQLASTLETLWTAIGSKKTVSIDYFSPRTNALTNRRVEPYGLALRRGAWTLVGHCHLRGAIRSFHVHRIRALSTNTARPRSPDFDIPHDFSVAAHVPTRLWHLRVHAPVNVEVSLSETLASWATRLFGANASGRPGAVTVTVTATHLDGLLETVLALGPDARIVGPETARARLSHLLTNVLGAHGATP